MYLGGSRVFYLGFGAALGYFPYLGSRMVIGKLALRRRLVVSGDAIKDFPHEARRRGMVSKHT